jgi:pyrimidine-nucleoside phosphorylase
MVRSGVRLSYPELDGTPVDKHSTGGVGDKTSLILGPLAAACGAIVPMMSGRGLGHTGGTLDKLESIPGFRTDLSLDQLRAALGRVGCALVGQSDEVAPADRTLYALRDVTATVESIPLISASIMSKKIAEGIGGLVLDVKTGDGAFMKTRDQARVLARALVDIGRASGVATEAIVTDMEAPLGRAVGNALEVAECLDVLRGEGPADLESLSVLLAARMLILAGLETDETAASARARAALRSGAALEKFRQIVENQGGDPRALDDPGRLPSAPGRDPIRAPRSGFVAAIRAWPVGDASARLGAGRARLDDAIDHGVGLEVLAPPGTAVRTGDAVLLVHHRGGRGLDEARVLLAGAVTIADEPPAARPLVLERIA